MSDVNPYAAPKSEVGNVAVDSTAAYIERLPVSPAWKDRFVLIAKAGGPKLPKFKDLAFGERMKINFNVLAFLFGPVYYAVKGMWRKGLALFVACVVVFTALSFILEFAGLGRTVNALGYAAAAVFAVRANIDFYKKMVLKDNRWW
jgi:hypothetical protein